MLGGLVSDMISYQDWEPYANTGQEQSGHGILLWDQLGDLEEYRPRTSSPMTARNCRSLMFA